MESSEEPLSPAEALVAVQGTRDRIADRSGRPRWHEVGLALFVAVEMLVQMVPVGPWHAVGFLLPVAVVLGAYVVDQFRSPYVVREGRNWPVWGLRLLLVVVLDGLLALGSVLVPASGARWLWIVFAAVAFVLVLALSRRLDRAWTAWLRSGR